MNHTPHPVCGVIPPHMLKRVATQTTIEASGNARATLEHMRELATGRAPTLLPAAQEAPPRDERRRVYDAWHRFELPGRLVITAKELLTSDVEALEAWFGSGATYDFFRRVFGRRSIDDRDMRLDATVHYGTGFGNAMWNGRQMVYGDGDGRVFGRFTASLDVIAHELTHGITQYSAALGYSGQTGALNEHLSDAFGIMVRQFTRGQSATESDWLIGRELFGPAVRGSAVRSFASPGSAYEDPILGRDPQPSHMRDYAHTSEDNGGVHINSGILNHAFYLAAMQIGGKTWEVLGRIWYAVLTERLTADANFDDFARATTDVAGQLYGIGSDVQCIVAEAWEEVGLHPSTESTKESHSMNHVINNVITYEDVDRSIATLNAEMEHENMLLLPQGANGAVQRVIKVYRRVKPLLGMISVTPFLPSLWRRGVVLFMQVLDSLGETEITAAFKAGKDLESAA